MMMRMMMMMMMMMTMMMAVVANMFTITATAMLNWMQNGKRKSMQSTEG
jgi:hypothetical protein